MIGLTDVSLLFFTKWHCRPVATIIATVICASPLEPQVTFGTKVCVVAIVINTRSITLNATNIIDEAVDLMVSDRYNSELFVLDYFSG